ncbi:cell division protein FtsQ/DivIB [Vaginella massiliensis]|uniref:cell division protein FtsQ/DivIB n=1 Tax=Vaginella massiliensis TaxID=1816680 RepID=UPI0037539D55
MKTKLKVLKAFLGLILLGVLVGFSVQRNACRKVKSFHINIAHQNNNYFLNDSVVKDILDDPKQPILKTPIGNLDLYKLEKKINASPYINSAQLSKDVYGNLNLEIEQKEPIARVNTARDEFYITRDGNRMPLSAVYSAPVMMIAGDVKENEYQGLSDLVQYINADNLLKNHIIAIQKVGQRSFNLIVNKGDYIIELGTLNNFDVKLKNLKLFYTQFLNLEELKIYKKISIKFVNQVVATKINENE